MKNSREERWRGMCVICISPLFLSLASFEHSHLLSRDKVHYYMHGTHSRLQRVEILKVEVLHLRQGVGVSGAEISPPPLPRFRRLCIVNREYIHRAFCFSFKSIHLVSFFSFEKIHKRIHLEHSLHSWPKHEPNLWFSVGSIGKRWMHGIQWSEATPLPPMIG